MLLQGTDCLHKRAFKIVTDAHDLSGCFHLRCQSTFCRYELIEWKSWNFHNAVIDRRLKARIGLFRNRILNLVKRITERNLRCHLGDRVTRCFGSQRRRAAHTGIYFNNTIFETGRMKRKLHVTTARDFQFIDDIQRRAAEHLIFFVAQRLRRCHNDAVSRMNADRIYIFHTADGNAVARSVAHYFVFDFFPAGNAAFHKNLSHTGKAQAVRQNFFQFHLIVRDAAAGTAERIGRTQYDRISDFIREINTVFYIFYNE